jgi:hypothetical protein
VVIALQALQLPFNPSMRLVSLPKHEVGRSVLHLGQNLSPVVGFRHGMMTTPYVVTLELISQSGKVPLLRVYIP